MIELLTFRCASRKRISYKRSNTTTERIMINHFAFSVEAARPWAWVNAFLVDAGLY